MAFFYNSVTKTFLFAPRETPPYVPGAPDEPSFGLIRDGDLGARDCCCCPCCAVPEGSQIYVCTNDTKKRRCINDGGTPNCSTPTCQPDTCCNGACCQGTSCSITADIVCQQLGGVFKGCGTTCAAGVCECPAGQVLCGNVCCPEGQSCVDGECVDGACSAPCQVPGPWNDIGPQDAVLCPDQCGCVIEQCCPGCTTGAPWFHIFAPALAGDQPDTVIPALVGWAGDIAGYFTSHGYECVTIKRQDGSENDGNGNESVSLALTVSGCCIDPEEGVESDGQFPGDPNIGQTPWNSTLSWHAWDYNTFPPCKNPLP